MIKVTKEEEMKERAREADNKKLAAMKKIREENQNKSPKNKG